MDLLFFIHVLPYLFLFDVMQLSTLYRTYLAVLFLNSMTIGLIFYLVKVSHANRDMTIIRSSFLKVILISAAIHHLFSFFAMFISIGISLVTITYLIVYFKRVFLTN